MAPGHSAVLYRNQPNIHRRLVDMSSSLQQQNAAQIFALGLMKVRLCQSLLALPINQAAVSQPHYREPRSTQWAPH